MNDKWLNFGIHMLFLGVPLLACLVGFLFLGKDTANDGSEWRLGKSDPFRTIIYDDEGNVREGNRRVFVAAFSILLALAIISGVYSAFLQ